MCCFFIGGRGVSMVGHVNKRVLERIDSLVLLF